MCRLFAVRNEQDETTPLVYQRMFSNESWKARLARTKSVLMLGVAATNFYPESVTPIITPPAILSQWERNQRHTISKTENHLEVLVYNG
jgi:hypothetical protein